MKKGQQTKKSLETRERLLEVALGLFKEKGFEKTTMRDIAKAASLAVGSAYYYFGTKDELVLAFYAETQESAEAYNMTLLAEHKDFRSRIQALLNFRLKELLPYRSFIDVLARNAADAANPLSPFSTENKEIRERAIKLFEQVFSESKLTVAKAMRPYLPKLFWFYQMGLIYFWINDHSPKQQRTTDLINHSLSIIIGLIRLSKLPLMSPVNASVIKLLKILEFKTETK